MKTYTYTHKITDEVCTITLEAGDMLKRNDRLTIEIGQNDTMRAIVDGTPDPKGWQPIPDVAVKELALMKMLNG